jgi:ribosomal protein L37E
MALVPCPDCKNKISNMAEACPHCGFPIREVRRLRTEKKAAERRKEAEKRRCTSSEDSGLQAS